jgi:hypothetical protein
MTVYVYTSIALNYFPKARVLSTTLKRFHPDWKFCILVSEDVDSKTRQEMLSYTDIDEVISYDQLSITDGFENKLSDLEFKQWCFKHSIVEFCTAVKGSALCYILDKPDCEAAFYFDPDIAIFDSLIQLTNHFNNGQSILLTPHLIDIEITKDGVWDNEISTLRHGIYNLGFIGVKNDANGHKFAKWWKSRLDMHCYDDIPNGVFTDQSWCDMVPAVFDGVHVLRDPQYNVSTWNLNHRTVDGDDLQNLYVNEKYKLCFYHFSGFDSGAQLAMLNKYAQGMPKLFLLRDWYIAECKELDNPEFSLRKWKFNYFSDGTNITKAHRQLYLQRPDLQQNFPDPFLNESTVNSYSKWFKHKIGTHWNNQYNHELNVILNSTSWKITKPLRILSSFFKKLI